MRSRSKPGSELTFDTDVSSTTYDQNTRFFLSSDFVNATVLEGAIRSSVNDGPVVTYRKGESFSEMPGDRHSVDENASKTEAAKLLAVFVVDTGKKQLLTPYEK